MYCHLLPHAASELIVLGISLAGPNEISFRDANAIGPILGVAGVPKSTCESDICVHTLVTSLTLSARLYWDDVGQNYERR